MLVRPTVAVNTRASGGEGTLGLTTELRAPRSDRLPDGCPVSVLLARLALTRILQDVSGPDSRPASGDIDRTYGHA